MKKGTWIFIIVAIIVIIAIIFGVKSSKNNTSNNENSKNAETSLEEGNNKSTNELATENKTNEAKNTNGKVLVVYYSAQSHTKAVAERIANDLNADTFVIEPKDEYTTDDLNYNEDNSRVVKEYKNESSRNIDLKSTDVPNWNEYDTILLGYPIWWGIAAWPTDTFVKAQDFTGKTVIPFCTSYSSGLGQSAKNLEKEANGGNWQEGHRFSQNADMSEVDNWVESLGL